MNSGQRALETATRSDSSVSGGTMSAAVQNAAESRRRQMSRLANTPPVTPQSNSRPASAESSTRSTADGGAAQRGQRLPPGSVRVAGLESWTGRIVELENDVFTAELQPSEGGTRVLADFDKSSLAGEPVVSVGDVIYVTVRTVVARSGHLSRTSSVRLRRVGNWTAADIDRHKTKAADLRRKLEGLVG